MKERMMFDPVKFMSDEEFSIETERELWAGYEQWLDEQVDRFEYQSMIEELEDA